MLSESIILQRLAFIKYLYKVAIEQSRQAEPLCSASILTFHDSIEMFLRLACEHLDAGMKDNRGFMYYWDVLEPKLPKGVPTQKDSMQRLNKSRVNLKHYGLLTSKGDIEGFRAATTNFLKENASLIFNADFDKISMVHLVTCEQAKASLQEAESCREKGDLLDALVKIRIAFAQLIDDWEDKKETYFRRSGFSLKESLESSFSANILYSKFGRLAEDMAETIKNLQGKIRILGLGLDYRRYLKFENLTPEIWSFAGAKGYNCRINPGVSPSSDDYKFCYDFVIESALRLQEFEFEPEA
jgi:hypothetical protein